MSRLSFCFVLFVCILFGCGSSSSSNGGRKVGVDASWYPLDLDQRVNNVTAFSTELLTQIGKVEKIPFVKVTVNWDVLMDGLKQGKYEAILTSMPPYIFNEKLFDFSDNYLPLGPVLVVPIDSKIDSIHHLEGKEIAVISGSSHVTTLETSQGVLIRNYDSIPKALNDAVAGTIDGVLVDILSAAAYCNDLYQGKLKIVTQPLNKEGLRFVTKHDAAPDLIKGFNQGLKKLKNNGAYTALLKKWGLVETVSKS